MITVTQFSGNLLKTAAGLMPRKNAPASPQPAPAETAPPAATPSETPAEAAAEDAPAQEAPSDEGGADGEAASEGEGEAAETAASADAPADGAAKPVEAASAADPAVLAKFQEQFGLDEARATRLWDVLSVVREKWERVRQVRVVKAEGAPERAPKHGEFAFVVDVAAAAPSRDARGGGRGGRGGDKGGRGGGGRGGGVGGRGAAGFVGEFHGVDGRSSLLRDSFHAEPQRAVGGAAGRREALRGS